ncbi:OmpA family protein [Umezakia ovalisporum]|jgi:outer membrane protein OmpA-like peptidoglycan-associated protein|uniref:Flagellar motor protein n=2 Tax=Umezakia ovalisporum TaxID=75695 RepID=A0AA43GWM3_9CYAN|nr:flagellar motor protein [Umezakia ovalisporum]MBI1243129.1 OmpA family protein [Nostoc sp. RI_552]MDH6055476.1 flagellar motor protein [Umezakia ovalisporum FSS-43]MDH6062806.1 flagellar motor protein [Umezakia ovalisporum FSS-62]MDH6067956.1 flagellar motor protein [Umezakia ovalisporum APH033B]MDH6070579.1 flagellar motor protein [Umezakia ovalisporum CobakiLakeA]
MARRWQRNEYNEELNISTAFTDLMSNAFMILLLFLLLFIMRSFINRKPELVDKQLDTPPIILIPDDPNHRFDSGSAKINPRFYNYIVTKILPEIERASKQYNVDIIEVIGHTDGQPNGSIASNLDLYLESVARGGLELEKLQAGSNADLGLMRALAVVQQLRNIQVKEKKLPGLSFRAYSAAQLILPSGEFAVMARQEDQRRRRIEIRFTRLGQVKKVN